MFSSHRHGAMRRTWPTRQTFVDWQAVFHWLAWCNVSLFTVFALFGSFICCCFSENLFLKKIPLKQSRLTCLSAYLLIYPTQFVLLLPLLRPLPTEVFFLKFTQPLSMILESERPPGVLSVDSQIWDVMNCTAVNRTCLPCDPRHAKCGWYLSETTGFFRCKKTSNSRWVCKGEREATDIYFL